MIDIKKLSYEALCFHVGSNEQQIAQLRASNRELIAEMQRRIPHMLQQHQKGEFNMEMSEEIAATQEVIDPRD
jgi:hypothetical protein